MPQTNAWRILFIINPVSGNGAGADLEKTIREYFKDGPHATEVFELTGTDDASSIKYWIDTWKPDRVVAAGGDGTLNAVAEVVMGTGLSLGILPAGSANGMARDLGFPMDYKECLDIITNDHTELVDIIRINDKDISIHLSDFGLNAQLIKQFEESDRRGMWGYAREVWKVIRNKEQFRVEVITPDHRVFRDAWMVVVANARMYGTGAMINPSGDLQDGLLEVIVMKKLSGWELLKMILKHHSFDRSKTEVIQAEEVWITVKKPVYFQVDGEYKGSLKKIHAVVQPKALKLLVPGPIRNEPVM